MLLDYKNKKTQKNKVEQGKRNKFHYRKLIPVTKIFEFSVS